MERFYTTTAIDYVNGAPHIGHAYEKILTDVIYRHFTQRCEDTYFLSGTDEHGIKIQKTSKDLFGFFNKALDNPLRRGYNVLVRLWLLL